jgi:predicted DNA-binding transcriptional regulator AlpA
MADNCPQSQRIVRERERRKITGVSTSSWYAMMKRGEAPRPVPISQGTVGWLHSELMAFIDRRVAARERGEGWRSVGDVAKQVVEKLGKQVSG